LARILVLDGHSAAALVITRSAGRAGHWVTVGANHSIFAPAKLSRYCQTSLEYPVSTNEPTLFLDAIIAFARSHLIDLIIPVTDWTLGPLSAQRERFANICHIAMPSKEALESSSDKYRTIQIAQSLGISVPATQLFRSDEPVNLPAASFPRVVKDRFSVRWMDSRVVFGSVSYANSAEELQAKVAERAKTAGDVLVQEFVSGVGVGVSCFVIGGELFVPFQWLREREVDPRGSASSARKSMPLDNLLISQSHRLIKEMGFEGIAMVEYKRTADGRLVLMEINGRPWGSIGLPVACGIDYPDYLIRWALQGTLPPAAKRYRENILCRRAVAELTHLSNIRRGRPRNWPASYPEFWPSLLRMALPWRPGVCYDDLSFSDPRPGVAGIVHWFRTRWKR